jgi:hypothetical protein
MSTWLKVVLVVVIGAGFLVLAYYATAISGWE